MSHAHSIKLRLSTSHTLPAVQFGDLRAPRTTSITSRNGVVLFWGYSDISGVAIEIILMSLGADVVPSIHGVITALCL